MAAEMIGGAFLSTLFGRLFEKLDCPEFVNFFRESKVNEGLLKKLKVMLCSAYQLVDDAEEKQLTNSAIREWLFELKEAIFVAEELLEDINCETLRHKQESKSGSSISKSLKLSTSGTSFNTFDKALEDIIDRLAFIVKQKGIFGLQEGFKHGPSLRLPAPLVDESCVYGRGDDKKNIIELLLSDNANGDNISVIPIVGMGGLGKTTLAQLVYDDTKVKDHFSLKVWVTVSDEFDIFKITKKIFLKTNPLQREIENDLFELQRQLKDALSGKTFLIILDDVWNESYENWDILKSPFQCGARGSKIIVTTRNKVVAEIMTNGPIHELQTVSEDDCWSLFKEHTLNIENLDSLQEIKRDILGRCKGLPLAIKSLAGILRSVSDLNEWKIILKSEMWELKSQNILPSLWLSYQYLPSHLKACFAYCSIFPKDYEFDESERERIILLWMAEGLLQPGDAGKSMEDVGEEYFQHLLSRSLFQRSNKDKSTLMMHDLVHDLAMLVSGEFSLRWDYEKKGNFSPKTRHFSYSNLDNFYDFSKATNLHACIKLSPYRSSPNYPSYSWPEQFLTKGRLRALSLPMTLYESKVLPDSISNSKHLRYLDLSGCSITKIPNSLCGLYNLQTLRFSRCRYLIELPARMGNLVNLRHLDITEVPLQKMPAQMCNMEDLRTLSQFVLGEDDDSASIKELRNLHHLSGSLSISKLKNVVDVADVLEANLCDKKYLSNLCYSWTSYREIGVTRDVDVADVGDDESRKHTEVLDALRPHTNVKQVTIVAYRGTIFSSWLGQNSYADMATLRLVRCRNCKFLPTLGQLPCLERLEINGCDGVVKIANEFYGNGSSSSMNKPFTSLKFLKFEYMSKWEEWSIMEGRCFPCLKDLSISHCGKLNVIRTDQMENAFPSLGCMNVENCPRLVSFILAKLPSNLESFLLGFSRSWQSYPRPVLYVKDCEDLLEFPGPQVMLPTTLTCLHISGVRYLREINGEGFKLLTSLQKLSIEYCPELQRLPKECLPTSLTNLSMIVLPKLEDLGGNCFQHLISLQKFSLSECEKLQCLLEQGLPSSLISLRIGGFPNLRVLSHLGIQNLISLEFLLIESCTALYCLPEQGLPPSLSGFVISNCPLLEPRCQKDTGEDWPKIAHIPYLQIF